MPLNKKFAHKAMIETKLDKEAKDPKKRAVLDACLARYQQYVFAFMVARNERNYEKMANALDAYLSYAKGHETQKDTFLGPRTKYYSSIVEEMPVLLCENTVESFVLDNEQIAAKGLILGDAECSIRIGANPDGSRFCETKRIDFCLAVVSTDLDANVPLMGFEVKKYMDKTMFGTVLETYKALQVFRPRTHYGFIVEDEARDSAVIRNSPLYDKEFILTGKHRDESKRNKIEVLALERFHRHLEAAVNEALRSLTNAA